MPEPKQTPTPEKTPAKGKSKSRPAPPSRKNSDEEAGDDPGYESRSRSASRRRRRQNQRQKGSSAKSQAQAGGGDTNASSQAMTNIPEDDEDFEPTEKQKRETYAHKDDWLKNPATQDTTETQPFEYLKPPSQSMDGPVTYARMARGEIPWRGPPPRQPYDTTQGVDSKIDAPDPMEQDGLKLRLELNLDIEIELKAHIHGDLTLALLA